MRIRVPGVLTSRSPLGQNLAIAISAAITVVVGPETLDWEVIHSQPQLPHDQTNPIVAVATEAAPGLLPHQLSVTSTLPLSQGLGGSNAATIAGLLLANALGDLHLQDADILRQAAEYEPYPAALTAAIHGGMQYRDPLSGVTTKHIPAPMQWLLYYPEHFIETSVPHRFEGLTTTPGDFERLVAALENDDETFLRSQFPLEDLRTQVTPAYFPQAEMVTRAVLQAGGYGSFVVGNGPALVCLAPTAATRFEVELRRLLSAGTLMTVGIDQTGATVVE